MTMNFLTKGKDERIAAATLLTFRICILLFSAILTLKTAGPLSYLNGLILLSFGIYQVLAVLMYRPVMSIGLTRVLFCSADLLIAQMVIFLTGGIYSPFIPCIFIPVFALHFIYRYKGFIYGLMGCAVSAGVIHLVSKGTLPAVFSSSISIGMSQAMSLFVTGISIVLFYAIPYFVLKQYFYNSCQLKSMEQKYNDLDDMNSKLLVLYEMTGRFNFENGIAQVMDRLLALCNELFRAERICIFLIRSGEVEIYGKPSPEEKEHIYQLIMEQKKANHQEEGREYILQEGTLVIPLIRGSRTDGVLSLNGWDQHEISNKEAILFSMIANMICTYLENLEYIECLQMKHIPDTSILLNHLDSGKPVRGILDKRIVEHEFQ
jgi:hypothetical protein